MKDATTRQAPRVASSTDNRNTDAPLLSDAAPRAQALPIEIAKFWKNRKRNESVVVSLSEFEGRKLINARVYFTGTDGIDRPTSKGLSLIIARLPELARALARAETTARSLGLIEASS